MKALTVAMILAFATSAVTAVADPPVSTAPAESPAVAQGKLFLQAVVTEDDAHFSQTLHDMYPATTITLPDWLDMRRHWMTFQYHGVESATSTHADLSALDSDRDEWVRLSVTVTPDAGHAITEFTVHRGRRPADVAAPPKLQPAALARAARDFAATQAAADRFAGVVLIDHDGAPVLRAAYGLADNISRAPNTMHTRFRIGSMGKMFTAVAIMQLVQAGRIDLHAPVGRYISDYPNQEIANHVTVDELMVHAGGTGDIFGPEFDAHHDTLINPEDYIALFGARPPLFAAGTRQEYSNYGFILLGRIVEKVSGLDYDTYLRRFVFGPAGMTRSGALPEKRRVSGRATGYASVDGHLEIATHDQVYRGTPAGGSYSTGEDMLRFAHALMSHRLLDAVFTDYLTTGMTTLPNGTRTRYDFSGTTADGIMYLGHPGGAPGQSGDLRIFPANGYVIVVLANRDPAIAGRIATFVSDRLP